MNDTGLQNGSDNQAKRMSAYAKRLLHGFILSEKEYPYYIKDRLSMDNGYVVRKAANFDRHFAMDRLEIIAEINSRMGKSYDNDVAVKNFDNVADIEEFYSHEENRREFEEWKKRQDKDKGIDK